MVTENAISFTFVLISASHVSSAKSFLQSWLQNGTALFLGVKCECAVLCPVSAVYQPVSWFHMDLNGLCACAVPINKYEVKY